MRPPAPAARFALFGFGYLAAGFGCTGLILVGLTGQAFTGGGGFLAAFVAFVVAALVIVALMFALALILAVAQECTIEEIKAGAPAVKEWGGRILVGVGAWFVALAVFADFFADIFPV